MFEPENEIERLLVRAAFEPSARAAFTRALMDAQVFLLLVPDGPIEPQADGGFKVPEGTTLNLPSATRGVDNLGSWQDVKAAIGRALAGGQLLDRALDAMPL